MRQVVYSTMVSVPNGTGSGRNVWELQEQGVAVFHEFGVDYEEFESGPGCFSIAIIELPDGKVLTVRADQIRFIDGGAA